MREVVSLGRPRHGYEQGVKSPSFHGSFCWTLADEKNITEGQEVSFIVRREKKAHDLTQS